MAKNIIPNVNYFLVGLGIGSAVGMLFAPKSGEKTREYLAEKASEGNEYARKKARELKDRAEDAVGRGQETIAQTKEQLAAAIDAGRKSYSREKSKALVS
jgi:gas vesicle protein